MASTVTETVAQGLKKYVLPARRRLAEKPIRRQMKEINGLIEFDKGLYHNQHYETHIKNIVTSRQSYRDAKNIGSRKEIAAGELKNWRDYVETRKRELPEEYLITDKMKGKFQQAWEIIKDRNEKTLQPSKILRVHEEYVKLFRFELPIDAKNLARLIHPHYAYLSYYPTPFEIEDVMDIYSNKIVSGYEDYLGQDLLAQEIAAYTYWNSIDKDQKGYMTLNEFAEFMKIFRLAVPSNLKEFSEEFKFALGFMQGEFDRDIKESDSIVRFDLMRHIFLERNL